MPPQQPDPRNIAQAVRNTTEAAKAAAELNKQLTAAGVSQDDLGKAAKEAMRLVQEETKKAAEETKRAAEEMAKAEAEAEKLKAAAERLAAVVQGQLVAGFNGLARTAGGALGGAFALGAVQVESFARQGLAAGASGELLGYQMDRLARTISGLFRPEVQALTEGLRNVTRWFSELSDAQRGNIANLAEGAAAFLAVSRVLGPLAGGIAGLAASSQEGRDALGELFQSLAALAARTAEAVGPLVQALSEALLPIVQAVADAVSGLNTETIQAAAHWAVAIGAFYAAFTASMKVVQGITAIIQVVRALNVGLAITAALSGPLGLLKLAAGVAAAATAVAAFNAMEGGGGEGGHKKAAGARGADAPRSAPIGSVESVWTRLAQRSVMSTPATGHGGGKSPEERSADTLDSIKIATEATAESVARFRSAVAAL